jgi:hypothetical protein
MKAAGMMATGDGGKQGALGDRKSGFTVASEIARLLCTNPTIEGASTEPKVAAEESLTAPVTTND